MNNQFKLHLSMAKSLCFVLIQICIALQAFEPQPDELQLSTLAYTISCMNTVQNAWTKRKCVCFWTHSTILFYSLDKEIMDLLCVINNNNNKNNNYKKKTGTILFDQNVRICIVFF